MLLPLSRCASIAIVWGSRSCSSSYWSFCSLRRRWSWWGKRLCGMTQSCGWRSGSQRGSAFGSARRCGRCLLLWNEGLFAWNFGSSCRVAGWTCRSERFGILLKFWILLRIRYWLWFCIYWGGAEAAISRFGSSNRRIHLILWQEQQCNSVSLTALARTQWQNSHISPESPALPM